MRSEERLRPAERVGLSTEIKDRRSRRNEQVSPYMIPLLRSPAIADITAPLAGKVDRPEVEDDQALVIPTLIDRDSWGLPNAGRV